MIVKTEDDLGDVHLGRTYMRLMTLQETERRSRGFTDEMTFSENVT